MFDTWGPYTCVTHDADGIDALWREFREESPANIEHGVGVYVVGVEDSDGTLTPWYVGQTYKSFGDRLKRHFDLGRFAELFDSGPLKIILIARAKDGKIIPRQSGSRERTDRKYIDWLEIDLIRQCLKVNRKLLNTQHKAFHNRIFVGGYTGDGALLAETLNKEPAYRALSNMLRLVPEH